MSNSFSGALVTRPITRSGTGTGPDSLAAERVECGTACRGSFLRTVKGRALSLTLAAAAVAMLPACEGSKGNPVDIKEVGCENQLCAGDVIPEYDKLREMPFKINGRWYFVNRDYGGYNGAMAFFWPSKVPANSASASRLAPEFIPSGSGKVSNFYDVGIEIFLHRQPRPMTSGGMYEMLLDEERAGKVLAKAVLHDGLERWSVQGFDQPQYWHIARKIPDSSGQPATVICRNVSSIRGRCTSAFQWRPGVSVDLRFKATHGKDWPEIYEEVSHVLSVIRENQEK